MSGNRSSSARISMARGECLDRALFTLVWGVTPPVVKGGGRGGSKMRRLLALAIWLCLPMAAQNPLQIYFVDVEGGGATLIIGPSGQSLLADTGNPMPDDRDAKRIFQVAQAAGLKK